MLFRNYSIFSICIIAFVSVIVFLFGFSYNYNIEANEFYNVYLDGNIVGKIESKDEFLDYINVKEDVIKKKYGVNSVYLPSGVVIEKSFGYGNSFDDNDTVFKKIINNGDITIKCAIFSFSNPEMEGFEPFDLYVKVDDSLDSDTAIFDQAIVKLIKAFVGDEEYQNYIDNNQAKIVDTGSLIDSIGVSENISYKIGYVPISENIFIDSDELSRYLLYGSLDEHSKYIVKSGDTISDIASNNSLNVREFLIANPSFTSENNLLYEGEEVSVSLINPIINIEEVVHSVTDEVHSYSTEIIYDPLELTIYEEVIREGEDGLDRVTKKVQYINGQPTESQNISSTVITPSTSKIVKKGSRKASHIADLSYWAWPTSRPYTITTYYGYRWGSMHAALDIAGAGYNSPIYAANNGTVVEISTGCVAGNVTCKGGSGNYVIINHNNGNYYTWYCHMLNVYVKVGDVVERGSKIGTMGNTGNVVPVPTRSNPYGGTHLHFATYKGAPHAGGRAFNPFTLY